MSSLASRFWLALLCVLVLCPAVAVAKDWTVARTTKQVSYTVDKSTWHPVENGSVVPNAAWISTGPRGRVTLTRDKESISLSPNTLSAVFTTEGLFSRKTDVIQQKGQIALNIEKRGRPHTFVHTPYLAAAVKGTSFTVTVTERAASLSVEEGLVQVSSFTGGQSTNVGPGQQVTVDQAQTMSVAGITEAPSVFSVEPTRASVAAVGQPAPVGAGLGLGSFGGQSSTSSPGSAGAGGAGGANGSSGESSESGSSNDSANANGNFGGNGGSPGNGPGKSDGPGPGQGSGNGYGPGKGEGPGKGDGPGKGNGPGKGSSPGDGKGPGKGEGAGPGQSPGAGHGPGHGPGEGHGPGHGAGGGAGPGPGQDRGNGHGPDHNPGAGHGPGNGNGPSG